MQATDTNMSSASIWSGQRLWWLLTGIWQVLADLVHSGLQGHICVQKGRHAQRLQRPPYIKKAITASVTSIEASICCRECRKQRGCEQETEEHWGQYIALSGAIGDKEGVRNRTTFHCTSHHSVMKRPHNVDESRWTV